MDNKKKIKRIIIAFVFLILSISCEIFFYNYLPSSANNKNKIEENELDFQYGLNVSGIEYIDGVKIHWENTAHENYDYTKEVFRSIPQTLKNQCDEIYFKFDINDDYYGQGNVTENSLGINGFANYTEDGHTYAYIKYVYDDAKYLKYVMCHELAHCADFHCSQNNYYSGSNAWDQTFYAEGSLLAHKYYNYDFYSSGDNCWRRQETFAMAVASYYCYGDELKENFPMAYSFIISNINTLKF